jgi:transcriptional regulator with XRE-family HTH domain
MTPTELTAAREAMRLSQRALAERLGVHPNMVNRWERGTAKTTPYLRLALERLAQITRSAA